MTSQEQDHVAFIREAFRLYDEGDLEALWALMHPDLELTPVFMEGTYQSRSTIRDVIADEGDPRERWSTSELEFREVGDRVVVAGRLHARAALGAPLNLPVAFVFHLRERLLTRVEGHMTLAQAVRSAELTAPRPTTSDPA
jgi:ketosteroid isomerase-like protein